MLNRKFFNLLISLTVVFPFSLGLVSCANKSKPLEESITEEAVLPLRSVAALGQLAPIGDVRRLAGPMSGFGGTPRIAQMLVAEGDLVNEGQILATFSNKKKILSELSRNEARIETLEIKILMQRREVSRYKKVALLGASSYVLLAEKEDELIRLQGDLKEVLAVREGLKVDLSDSELRSPINGIVLRIHTRVGERPGIDGVLEVGANQRMEALIEVYESDINRVSVGQSVSLVSENGGFDGTLMGLVERISPQVRQRRVLSTDPTGDVDARVVLVRVLLEESSSNLVRRLTGMRVIARFESP